MLRDISFFHAVAPDGTSLVCDAVRDTASELLFGRWMIGYLPHDYFRSGAYTSHLLYRCAQAQIRRALQTFAEEEFSDEQLADVQHLIGSSVACVREFDEYTAPDYRDIAGISCVVRKNSLLMYEIAQCAKWFDLAVVRSPTLAKKPFVHSHAHSVIELCLKMYLAECITGSGLW
jgi:hypothetical protein